MKKASGSRRTDVAGGPTASASGDTDLMSQLEGLRSLGERELRAEWQRLYRADAPRLSRDLLMRGVAYRIQELAFGGLSKAALRKRASFDKELREKGDLSSVPNRVSPRPGTKLLREWRGRTHAVMVVEGGFEYAGSVYPSLTGIAEKITGAHWSGPRFFGIGAKARGIGAKASALGGALRPSGYDDAGLDDDAQSSPSQAAGEERARG